MEQKHSQRVSHSRCADVDLGKITYILILVVVRRMAESVAEEGHTWLVIPMSDVWALRSGEGCPVLYLYLILKALAALTK